MLNNLWLPPTCVPCQAREWHKGMHYFESWGRGSIVADLYSQGTTGSMTFISIAAGTTGTQGTCSSTWEIRMICFFKKNSLSNWELLVADADSCFGITPCQQFTVQRLFFLSLPTVDTAAWKNFTCTLRDAYMYQESTAVGFKKMFVCPTNSNPFLCNLFNLPLMIISAINVPKQGQFLLDLHFLHFHPITELLLPKGNTLL